MNLYKSIPSILSRTFGTKFFLFLSAAFILSSCNEASVVGLDVQPANDLLNVVWKDTTTIVTRTVMGDSLITDETLISTGEALIGKYIDPVFGPVTGSMYTQVRLPSNILTNSFGTAPVCDSIALTLVYHGSIYGKKERLPQLLEVHQMTQPISSSPILYSDTTFTVNPANLTKNPSGFTFTPRPTNPTYAMNDTLAPQLWVPLDPSFGQLLLNNQTTGNLANNAAFQSFFHGIYITTENTSTLSSGEGNITHFMMGESKIILFYHNSTATGLKYEFSLGSVARVNHFTHNYSAGGIDPALAYQLNTANPLDTTMFVEGMAGVRTKVTFPYLKHLLDSGSIAINKAELVIKVNKYASYGCDTFSLPNNLMVFGINDDGHPYAIPDNFEGSTYFGGSYLSSTVEYKFNMARYIQQVLNGERNNNGLYLFVSSGAIFANRAIIGGGAPGPQQMKLNLTFTKIH